ncbi:MAG TPA: hypothetical protein DEB62_00560 [Vibrio sp.]|uniref:Uncharacterized protein n=1 Tax=Vibrio casei TaxID=673372 RepID=A0A368LLU5_9VIBR|nr:hypothetical protein CIK83_03845 [Vibrio casei]HBV74891.1 hypothetical protein [Vibrio sp.]
MLAIKYLAHNNFYYRWNYFVESDSHYRVAFLWLSFYHHSEGFHVVSLPNGVEFTYFDYFFFEWSLFIGDLFLLILVVWQIAEQ